MIDRLYSASRTITRLRSGPLGAHMDGFAEELSAQGYPPSTLRPKIRWVGYLNQWLGDRQIDATDLNEERIAEFLACHRATHDIQNPDDVTFRQLLCYLRNAGLVPEAVPKRRDRQLHPVLEEFAQYLAEERGLGATARRYQLSIAKRFLDERFDHESIDCGQLGADDVSKFTLRHAHSYTLRTAQTMLSALRGFLRFLHQRGKTPTDLNIAVHASGKTMPQLMFGGLR